jgi:hypothetical protein
MIIIISSATDFSLHICSSSFAASIIANLHISLPSHTPSCQWPVGGCPTPVDVRCHWGKLKMFVCIVRNVIFEWLGKTGGHIAFWVEFWSMPRQSFLTPIKLGLSRENQDEWNPYLACMLLVMIYSTVWAVHRVANDTV